MPTASDNSPGSGAGTTTASHIANPRANASMYGRKIDPGRMGPGEDDHDLSYDSNSVEIDFDDDLLADNADKMWRELMARNDEATAAFNLLG